MRPSLLACGLALFASTACGGGGEAGGTGTAASQGAIPTPDLTNVDPDVVRAIREERAALEADLDSASAWGKLGTRYFVHEFEEEASRCLERAEELEPDKGMWPYRLGWTQFDHHPELALASFQRALVLLEDYAPAQEAVGRALSRLGRADEAYPYLLRASELDPKSAHAETALGQIELDRGHYERAQAHLEEALARDEKHVEAHIAIAQVYLALGRESDAQRHAERSRRLPPQTPRQDLLASMNAAPAGKMARTRQGLELENSGRLKEAAEQYRVVLEIDPGYAFVRTRLAGVLVKQGKPDQARSLLEVGLELDPESPELRQALAKLERP